MLNMRNLYTVLQYEMKFFCWNKFLWSYDWEPFEAKLAFEWIHDKENFASHPASTIFQR